LQEFNRQHGSRDTAGNAGLARNIGAEIASSRLPERRPARIVQRTARPTVYRDRLTE
jgi:hypothetical protein